MRTVGPWTYGVLWNQIWSYAGNTKRDDVSQIDFSKLSSFGTFPASYLIGFGGFAASPEIGPDWEVRAALTILLPRKKSAVSGGGAS